MAERDYSHRRVVDKLGIKPGHAVAIDELAGQLDRELQERIIEQTARPPAEPDEKTDVVLVMADEATDTIAALMQWKVRLVPTGGIWLLTPKRTQPGYVDQRKLIADGIIAGLVDNKVCSVSDTTSAIRFVIRRADRP